MNREEGLKLVDGVKFRKKGFSKVGSKFLNFLPLLKHIPVSLDDLGFVVAKLLDN